MATPRSRLLRFSQMCVSLYLVISVLYTTNSLFFKPLRTNVSSVLHLILPRWFLLRVPQRQIDNSFQATTDLPAYKDSGGVQSPWQYVQLDSVGNNELGSSQPLWMDSELLVSKAFANSMHPSKIIPYFYRATGHFDKEDITITTLVTSNRFKVLHRLVERYQGPISVTIHVKNSTEDLHWLLDSLHALYISSEKMLTNVDVHLVIDSFDRQFNTWRNVARLFARTDFVMMLDIDFYPCTDFRTAILSSAIVKDKLREGYSALVIPAFEYSDNKKVVDPIYFPRDKPTLLSLVKARQVRMFHASWALGHNSTNYPRFYGAPPGEVYKVTQYQAAYEPYIIFKKDGPPWCDERFVGYGGNKAACLFEMYLSGISYYVLSDHFIIHQNHLYEEEARKNERKLNRKLYTDFKEEICLRYLKSYYGNDVLNTTRGYNAITECFKMRNVKRIATQIFREGH